MPARKTALLIGNDAYQDHRLQPLVVPTDDVRGLAAVLADPASGGFERVLPLLNADRGEVVGAIEQLFDDAGPDDLVLLYFSGHGFLDRLGRLYLAVAESNPDRREATAVRAELVRELIELGRCRRQLLILDCCHAGAFARQAKAAGATPAVLPETFASQGEGRVALLSSTATQRSIEGDAVDDEPALSLFTRHLIDGLRGAAVAPHDEHIDEEALFQHAYRQVQAAGAGMTPQRWVGRQHGRLVIARNPAWRPTPAQLLPARLLEHVDAADPYVREGAMRELGRRLRQPGCDAATRDAIRGLLSRRQATERDRFVHQEIEAALAASKPVDSASPVGAVSGRDSPAKVRQAQDPSPPPPPPKTPTPTSRPTTPEPFTRFRDRLQDGSDGPEMIWLPPGRFLMGSPDSDDLAFDSEKPQHEVEIARPFAIGRFPVTFDDYARFCAATGAETPSDWGWGRGNRPVIDVSWNDALAYCQWLAEQTGRAYRLPSEAEWEYACRAGTRTRYSFGDDPAGLGEHAWFRRNAREKTHPVGEKAPNPWGLHDMHGNVWEWVQDQWHGDYQGAPTDATAWEGAAAGVRRALRGGYWFVDPRDLRSAHRLVFEPGYRYCYTGLRLARGPEQAGK